MSSQEAHSASPSPAMSQYDWPSSRVRAPAFPWDAQPRAPPRRGAPNLSDGGDQAPPAAKPTTAPTMALVPVQLGVGAFRAPIPRVMPATAVRVPRARRPAALDGQLLARLIWRCTLTHAPRAPQVPPGSFGRGGAQCCGEVSDAGESGVTARSVFGFPGGGASVASASMSLSCAAFGAADDGAEVTSGAAQAAAQQAVAALQPLPLPQPLLRPLPQPMQRAHFFTQLGPPPGLAMYYGSGGPCTAQPSQEHMAVDAAPLVPAAAPGRKRVVPEEWVTVERPPRVYRGFDEADMAYEQARARASRRAARPLIHAQPGC